MLQLRPRLRSVMQADPHATEGRYFVRSLYFDTPDDTALRQKLDGVSRREKFRIRYYNGDTSLLHLEKKTKLSGLGCKEKAPLSAAEVEKLLAGDTDWMMDSPHQLVRELHSKMQSQQLRPKTVVDYTREPYVFPAGNVRVTLDYHIRTALHPEEFLDPRCTTIPAGDAPILMEVKWDEFLPAIIRDLVQLSGRRAAAFSKYAQCRIYG